VKWQELYSEKPKKVYDADSCYNWIFSPRRLFEGHGYKIKPCLNDSQNDSVTFSGSNCNASLITKKSGEDERAEDGNIFHNTIEEGTVKLMEYKFPFVVKQDIIMQMNGQTNGTDNRFGLVEFLFDGDLAYGRLIEGDTNRKGEFKLIEAVR
jgi:hypothetical protein